MAKGKGNKVEKRTAVHSKETVKASAIEIAAATASGDLRDIMLHHFKNAKKAWPQMSEAEQEQIADSFQNAAEEAVRTVGHIISADGNESILVTLSGVASKDGDIVAKIKTKKTPETWGALGLADGYPISLIIKDVDKYIGEKAPPQIDKDQASLLEEEDGEEGDGDRAPDANPGASEESLASVPAHIASAAKH